MITVETPCISDYTLSLKGQLHTHTTRSDGTRSPQQVIDEYAARNKNTDPDCICQWSLTGTDNHVPHRFGELKFL